MATVICHLARADRGAQLREARLVGLHGEESWTAPTRGGVVDPVEAIPEDARSVADWIAGTLADLGGTKTRRIERLCLDTDGAVCAWVSAASGAPDLVRAEAERQTRVESHDPDGLEAVDGYDVPPRFPDLEGELAVEPLAVGAATNGHAPKSGGGLLKGAPFARSKSADVAAEPPSRVGVIAAPDVPARLLLDELDRQNVGCGPVVSLWHVMASVWDPSNARRPATESDALVQTEPGCAAAVVIDPAGERLLWTWTTGGVVVAAGSMRLPLRAGADASTGSRAGGRVVSEWLSWAAQLGMAPERVVCVAPPERSASAPVDTATLGDGGMNGDAPPPAVSPGFGARAFAGAIGRAWPDATVDLITEEDPLALTLRRYAERVDAGRDPLAERERVAGAELQTLTDRPGRAHRWMYRWAAVAMMVAAVCVGVIGWKVRSDAGDLRDEAASYRDRQRELLESIDPSLDWRFPQKAMENLVSSTRSPSGAEPPFEAVKPILQGLEALSFVIGAPDFQLESVSLTEGFVQLYVYVESLESFEDLQEAVRNVAGFPATLQQADIDPRTSGGFRASFTFLWNQQPIGGSGGGQRQ